MSDTDTIEQRLRRAFRAVAEQPVTIPRRADSPWTVAPPPSHRRLGLLAGVAAVVVTVAGFGLVLAYGPRSSDHGGNVPPVPVTGRHGRDHLRFRVVYGPVTPASGTVLQHEASLLRARLRLLAVDDPRVTVTGQTIGVTFLAQSDAAVRDDLAVLGKSGSLSVRPVECGAPAYSPPAGAVTAPTSTTLPACAPQDRTDSANLVVTPRSGTRLGYTAITVPPDPAFGSYPSLAPVQAQSSPTDTVLLSAATTTAGQKYPRYVLGPSEFIDTGITRASFSKAQRNWVVTITVAPSSAAQWDSVAHQNFHQMVAFVVNGQVISASLVLPAQTSFSSYGGTIPVAVTRTAEQARNIAALLDGTTLLRLESMTTVSSALSG
jgi:hypothetical protein